WGVRRAKARTTNRPILGCLPREIRIVNNSVATPATLRLLCALVALFGLVPQSSRAQDRLPAMPGYEQYQKMSKQIPGSVKLVSLAVTWKDGGKAFEYGHDGKRYRYDVAARKAEVVGAAKD